MKWPIKRLSELSEVITKGTTPTSLGFSYASSGVRFLRAQNINYGNVNFYDDDLHIDFGTHKALARSQIKNGDLLVSIAGSIGRSGIVVSNNEPLNCNQAVAIVRLKKEVNENYISHVLDSQAVKEQIRSSTVTGVISNLSLSQLGNLKIPLPPLVEQQRIAAVLDTADRILKKRESAIVKMENLIRSYFYEIVLKNSTTDQLFELGSVVELKYGKSLPSQNRRDGEFNVYGSNGVVGSHIESITSGETIIVGRKGSFGEINLSLDSCFPIDTTYYIDKSATKQNIVWLRYALETLKLNTLNKSAAVPGLNREDAYRQKLQLINRNLQNDFEVRIRKIWSLIKTQNDFIHKHKRLIASLQHQSFAIN